jgi:DNA mismatch endonuclease Vsr
MDTLTPAERSARMALIRSKDTEPEMLVRRCVTKMGYRYRLHCRDLPGKPDIVFPGRKKVIFVHGCFWHAHEGCKVSNRPKSRTAFWLSKFAYNKARDLKNKQLLRHAGWNVMTIWECETKDEMRMRRKLSTFLGPLGPRASRT